MKVTIISVLAIACAAVLVLGNIHWDKKTTVAVGPEQATQAPSEHKASAADHQTQDLLSYATNWPENSQEQFKQKIEENQPFHIIIAGSESLAAENNGWPNMVKASLEETYGEAVKVDVQEYDMNSSQFVQQDKQQELTGDMIILEPFTLKDNGVVRIEDSIANLETIIDDVTAAHPNTEFLIQPPHPLYDARFYPIQVNQLKKFAEDHQLTYLDHWSAWPDAKTEEIKDYLLEDQSAPNERGHEIWAKFIEDFLIKK